MPSATKRWMEPVQPRVGTIELRIPLNPAEIQIRVSPIGDTGRGKYRSTAVRDLRDLTQCVCEMGVYVPSPPRRLGVW